MWLLICYLYRDVCYLRDVCTNFIVLNHARRNQSGRSGHGPTKISAERTSLQGYRYSCGRLDGGVVEESYDSSNAVSSDPACTHVKRM